MNHQFAVLEAFRHEYPVCRACCAAKAPGPLDLKKGDVLTITCEKKYVDLLGWFFLININGERQVYMSISDLEDYYLTGKICSFFDLALKINHLSYKVNQSLDCRNKKEFGMYSEQLRQWKEFQESVYEKDKEKV